MQDAGQGNLGSIIEGALGASRLELSEETMIYDSSYGEDAVGEEVGGKWTRSSSPSD